MPRDGSDDEPRRSRRGAAAKVNYNEGTLADDTAVMEDSEQETPPSEEDDDEEMLQVDEEELDDDDEEEVVPRRGGRRRRGTTTQPSRTQRQPLRTSSRSTKCTRNMDEGDSLFEQSLLLADSPTTTTTKSKSKSKSPARRHAQRRRSLTCNNEASLPDEDDESSASQASDDDDDELLSMADDDDDDEDDDEDDSEPIKIQRILASRTETKRKWQEICAKMNTSEIDCGSRWFQQQSQQQQSQQESSSLKDDDADSGDDLVYEERFLIKWSDLSYLHVSWETQHDLLEQVEGAKTYMSTFFRKARGGFLLTPDERCDGDYFDPAWTEIDRILEMDPGNPLILDKNNNDDKAYEDGTGRQFLIKWGHTPYADASYEFERDLILQDVEYENHVAAFEKRGNKLSKRAKEAVLKKGESEVRRLRAVFGSSSTLDDADRAKVAEKYQRELQDIVFKNGGQLRDYQAEGVAWMVSNYINDRSSILADEMGLGKTLQTAIFTDILLTKINCGGPALVVVPLSTITHWYREFTSWTDLNAVVYHGSAADRNVIRNYEMAYERDRPQGGVSFNSLYLKKCGPKRFSKSDSPWMLDVLITTPEMLVADDFLELTAIKWELLVVDEAHRLKNHNSKLAVNLRDERFTFRHKLLLTGTPIQNSVEEFWSLLNMVDEEQFNDAAEFMDEYGEIKSKERVDQLHEEIRPYILRRLKEDVEKSVPQKSETLIEVELTVQQKQWYRALYEKNLRFLHRNKKKALDGPGLNNLAMELRKCCNHLFLLNGVEEEIRREQTASGMTLAEGDFLAKASGKLVLLDKLLPRLKEEGHRVLIFSQFKIMLDILEDYLNCRSMKFERIDGSITGNKRQQAIDRFQAPEADGKELPFIMMLSTRAGGVGINLTAADTCIIFDSDFNPQNDLQAQARCHRIGQTKTVKVYRLLTRKTYEMQMFHMSSLKMGLDQAVLKGFESGSSSEGALSKAEVEKLLRHGAYDIFNEDKSGTAEAESNDFVQQDIDSILERRSRTVIHENTGSSSNAAGGTFSKARFTSSSKTPDGDKNKSKREDIDIEDPDFWKKMIGEAEDADESQLESRRRQRTQANYSEKDYQKRLDAALRLDYNSESDGGSSDEDDEEGEDSGQERSCWGGSLHTEWKKEDAELLFKALTAYGYSFREWDDFFSRLQLSKEYTPVEMKRMCWALVLSTISEAAVDDVGIARRKEEKAAKKKTEDAASEQEKKDGGILADLSSQDASSSVHKDTEAEKEKAFLRLWESVSQWCDKVLVDAVAYAKDHDPRDKEIIETIHKPSKDSEILPADEIKAKFAQSLWPSLRGRGWKATTLATESGNGETRYMYKGEEFSTIEAVLTAARTHHSELSTATDTLLASIESNRQKSSDFINKERQEHLSMTSANINLSKVRTFLERYGPLQLLRDRHKAPQNRVRLGKRLLFNCTYLLTAQRVVDGVKKNENGCVDMDRLEAALSVDKKSTLPHPLWTSRHDAILVYAISKHGWIDHDKCCQAITKDPSVKWGAPFEQATNQDALVARKASAELLEAANRAANLLNTHGTSLFEMKHFNFHLVVRTYGLIRQGTAGESPSNDKWVVDPSKLELSPNSGGAEDQGLAELPTKKDLVKRAKLLLTRASKASARVESEKPAEPNTHGFAVLDQSEHSNVLLAEILHGVLKTPASSTFLKVLCNAAVVEARKRVATVSESAAAAGSADSKAEIERIYEQVQLVKSSLSKGTTQAKNLVRVMLGGEPSKVKKAGDALFPKARPPPLPFRSTQRSLNKNSSSGASRAQRSSTGDAAIRSARKRLKETYSDPKKLAAMYSDSSLLQLTEVETLILSTLCAHGMPTWRKDFQSAMNVVEKGKSSFDSNFTWGDVGRLLEQCASEDLAKARTVLEGAKQNPPRMKSGKAENRSRENLIALLDLESDVMKKEDVVTQAGEYAAEPDTLAKKSIMLIAKVRQTWGEHRVGHFSDRALRALGTKVLKWQDDETTRWANSLDLMEAGGRPLGFTAIDFMDDIPDEDKAKIQISAILDKKGSKEVHSQMSVVTKIRSLAGGHDPSEMDRRTEKAVKAISDGGDLWENEPSWWISNESEAACKYDKELLDRLVEFGLTDKLVKACSVPTGEEKGNGNRGLSKMDLQVRAGQLARELSAADESIASFRRLDAIRAKKTNGDGALTNHNKPIVQQKGLHAFFSKKDDIAKTVIEIDDSSTEKRKGTESPVSASPEKKHRTT